MSWIKYPGGSERSVANDHYFGVTWYHDGAYCWRVSRDGEPVKEGTGCIDRAEAQREADFVIAGCLDGSIDPPWAASKERQETERRLLDARAAQPPTLPKYWP